MSIGELQQIDLDILKFALKNVQSCYCKHIKSAVRKSK
jgi:hypothetical protein